MELAKHLLPQENIKGNCEVGLRSERWRKTIEVTIRSVRQEDWKKVWRGHMTRMMGDGVGGDATISNKRKRDGVWVGT